MNTDVPARIEALERAIASADADARAAVRELLVDDGARYLVLERLPRLGPRARAPIRELLSEPGLDPEVRTMAALVGVEVGEMGGTDVLLDEVAAAGSLGPIAAARLVAHEEHRVAPAIVDGLRVVDVADVDTVVAYLAALRNAGEPLPPDVRTRIAATSAWQITSAVDEWFPDR